MEGRVKLNGKIVGYLKKHGTSNYAFDYVSGYAGPPIARAFKDLQKHYSRSDGNLFPFFSGLLSEGVQKDLQSRILKIDPNDEFTRLLKTASKTIGAVTIHPVESKS
jgi:HipA-like protein